MCYTHVTDWGSVSVRRRNTHCTTRICVVWRQSSDFRRSIFPNNPIWICSDENWATAKNLFWTLSKYERKKSSGLFRNKTDQRSESRIQMEDFLRVAGKEWECGWICGLHGNAYKSLVCLRERENNSIRFSWINRRQCTQQSTEENK